MKFVKLVFLAIFAGGVIGAAFFGWTNLYSKYLEASAPEIAFGDGEPRGIGLTPITVHLELTDWGAGLDEVVARVHQRGMTKEVLRQGLRAQKNATVAFELAGESIGLEEGSVTLEIKAFDRSFWSNSTQKTLELRVDYRKPRLEVVSAMHNSRRGGAGLVIYKALDESLAVSGVKVGNQSFVGFPAAGLDKELEEKGLFAALYTVALGEGDEPAIRLFAQDTVGNGSSTNFNYRILPRAERPVVVKTQEEFLRGVVSEIADKAHLRLEQLALATGESFSYRSSKGSDAQLYEKLRVVVGRVIPLSSQELLAPLRKVSSLERSWTRAFVQPNGVVLSGFGDRVTFKGDWVDSPSFVQTGFEFQMSKSDPAVIAAADGIVTFVGEVGTYGRIVIVDHGLGLATVYGHLESTSVRLGSQLVAGEQLGSAGRTGFARTLGSVFEVRIQGVPSDPREFWDRGWFQGHIIEKIEAAKRSLGLTGVMPLE